MRAAAYLNPILRSYGCVGGACDAVAVNIDLKLRAREHDACLLEIVDVAGSDFEASCNCIGIGQDANTVLGTGKRRILDARDRDAVDHAAGLVVPDADEAVVGVAPPGAIDRQVTNNCVSRIVHEDDGMICRRGCECVRDCRGRLDDGQRAGAQEGDVLGDIEILFIRAIEHLYDIAGRSAIDAFLDVRAYQAEVRIAAGDPAQALDVADTRIAVARQRDHCLVEGVGGQYRLPIQIGVVIAASHDLVGIVGQSVACNCDGADRLRGPAINVLAHYADGCPVGNVLDRVAADHAVDSWAGLAHAIGNGDLAREELVALDVEPVDVHPAAFVAHVQAGITRRQVIHDGVAQSEIVGVDPDVLVAVDRQVCQFEAQAAHGDVVAGDDGVPCRGVAGGRNDGGQHAIAAGDSRTAGVNSLDRDAILVDQQTAGDAAGRAAIHVARCIAFKIPAGVNIDRSADSRHVDGLLNAIVAADLFHGCVNAQRTVVALEAGCAALGIAAGIQPRRVVHAAVNKRTDGAGGGCAPPVAAGVHQRRRVAIDCARGVVMECVGVGRNRLLPGGRANPHAARPAGNVVPKNSDGAGCRNGGHIGRLADRDAAQDRCARAGDGVVGYVGRSADNANAGIAGASDRVAREVARRAIGNAHADRAACDCCSTDTDRTARGVNAYRVAGDSVLANADRCGVTALLLDVQTCICIADLIIA